jgi:hypothetical protein
MKPELDLHSKAAWATIIGTVVAAIGVVATVVGLLRSNGPSPPVPAARDTSSSYLQTPQNTVPVPLSGFSAAITLPTSPPQSTPAPVAAVRSQPNRTVTSAVPVLQMDSWAVEVTGRESGGGMHGPVSVTFTSPPSSIDVSPHFSPTMSPRNVLIDVAARTREHVTVVGPWLYRFRFGPDPVSDCSRLSVTSGSTTADGEVQALGAKNVPLQPVDISLTHDTVGYQELTVTLNCYILNARFPRIGIDVEKPGGTTP